jgi:hypothetical protein
LRVRTKLHSLDPKRCQGLEQSLLCSDQLRYSISTSYPEFGDELRLCGNRRSLSPREAKTGYQEMCVVVIDRSCVPDRMYISFSRNSAALDFQSCLGSMCKCWHVFPFSLSHAPREDRDVRLLFSGVCPSWCFGGCFWKLDLLAKVLRYIFPVATSFTDKARTREKSFA